jgi:hypothetical protein
MRAKFVNEKFSEGGDAIRDMGIGMNTKTICKGIMIEDNKHHLIPNNHTPGNIREFVVTGAVGRNKQHLTGTYFKIQFWGDEFYTIMPNGKMKRMFFRDKANYANQIIKDAGFDHMFSDFNWNVHDKAVINFVIKPEFRGLFKPGHYQADEIS